MSGQFQVIRQSIVLVAQIWSAPGAGFTQHVASTVRYPRGIPPPAAQIQWVIDGMIARQGEMKSRQGRFAEGEADVRRALLNRLRTNGKYHVLTAQHIGFLANQLIEQGRYGEAEQLTRARLDILRTLRLAEESENSSRRTPPLKTISTDLDVASSLESCFRPKI
jgi:hypothetical protein